MKSIRPNYSFTSQKLLAFKPLSKTESFINLNWLKSAYSSFSYFIFSTFDSISIVDQLHRCRVWRLNARCSIIWQTNNTNRCFVKMEFALRFEIVDHVLEKLLAFLVIYYHIHGNRISFLESLK